nr:MAG TPA: hypothetical protein [Caudoviricetes sp.]
MAFRVKDDFQAGRPMSQVPTAWFNAVGHFINWIVGGFGIKTNKSDSGKMEISLDRDVLRAEIDNAMQGKRISKEAGTPVDCTDDPNVLDANGATIEWTVGGKNGFELDCYCKISSQTSTSNYSVFQRCTLTFSKDGLLVSGKLLPDRIRIQAKNA